MRLPLILLLATALLTAVAGMRPPEYDEAYTMFLTAGDARPNWPSGVFWPADIRGLYAGRASPWQIARDLRRGDVHPPLYFWLLEYWRRLFGASWFTARLLSVALSVAALAALAWLARLTRTPAAPALCLTLLSYGFAYTGTVARGFALAQLLNIGGVALLLAAAQAPVRAGERPGLARFAAGLVGGACLGAAGFTNYLATFIGFATLFWLLLARRRLFLPAACGFALFLPADAYFFWGQRASRAGQFAAFSLRSALGLLAKDFGAAWFGGLPLYAGAAAAAVAALLACVFAACLAAVAKRRAPYTPLFALAAVATPAGLLAMGLVFHNTPIEIRYLAFGLPFLALLFAAALPRWLLGTVLALQAAAIIGLALAPATMQPQGIAARQAAAAATPGTLVLVPYGNDGVGIPGPFLAAAPDLLRVTLVRAGAAPDISRESRLILAAINGDDASRETNQRLLAAFAASPCWRRAGDALTPIFLRICQPH